MVLLAQFSDVHLGPLPRVLATDLASKRLLGYLNWQRSRSRIHADSVLSALVADMHTARPDQVVVTGDLVNLGLPAEYRAARVWLSMLGSPRDVTVIPGNHDAYVASGVAHFTEQWRDFSSGDGRTGTQSGFPFLRRRGPLALIGVSSAVPTGPLMATGRVGAAQAAALGPLLAEAKRDGLFRVVLIHHPVAEHSAKRLRRLVDAARVRAVIAEHGAELVLHGHNHRTSVTTVPGPHGPVPVVGATATSLRPRPHHAGGGYNLFAIDGEAGAWRLTLRERAVTEAGMVETRLERTLAVPGSG
jgi:3',5'-cyclic AMP phosphodiesterase CpdA